MLTHKELILCYAYSDKMSYWENQFISKMYEGCRGTGLLNEEQIKDYLSEKEISKIKEITKTYFGEKTARECADLVEKYLPQERWNSVSGSDPISSD